MTGSIKQNKPFILGVAGGSGSGKTYFARAVHERLGAEYSEIIYQDNFYIDQSKRFDFDGGSVNFDHPDAIDFSLLSRCLKELKSGREAKIPVYDFSTHKRQPAALPVAPKAIVIVDGILIFHAKEVRELFDDLIFFETPEELRFQRRLERDVKERGRSPEGVHSQFYRQVKPMHDAFVEPSKVHAHTLVSDLGSFNDVMASYCDRLAEICRKR